MSNVDISVITICYKDPTGLARTIQSLGPLVRKAGFSWEHVVIDSSPDSHDAALKGLGDKWPLKRIVSSREGIYAAFNRGIDESSGRFVWFLNSGDELADTSVLQEVCETLGRKKAPTIWVGSALLLRDNVPTYRHVVRSSFERNLTGRNFLCHQAMVYMREVFDHVGKFELNYCSTGDYEHHLRSYLSGVELVTSPRTLCRYDMSGGSTRTALVFGQFKQIQELHRTGMPRALRLKMKIVRNIEFARVSAFDLLKTYPLTSRLKSVWYAYKNYAGSRSRQT